jgi:hypothetical protein
LASPLERCLYGISSSNAVTHLRKPRVAIQFTFASAFMFTFVFAFTFVFIFMFSCSLAGKRV